MTDKTDSEFPHHEPSLGRLSANSRPSPVLPRSFRALSARLGQAFSFYVFTSLTRRILILNLAALIALVCGILYLNQFRAGLIDARVESLLTQGEIIAGAIAASATVETNAITIDPERLLRLQTGDSVSPLDDMQGLDFPINPERVAPILRRLISPTRTRARIYDRDGLLLLDSRFLYSRGQVLRFDLPPPENAAPSLLLQLWEKAKYLIRRTDLPVYEELGGSNGRGYPEVAAALEGSPEKVVRVNDRGEMIVSVAVPIQRFRAVVGCLLLSTQGGDIDAIVAAERLAIMRVFLVAALVTGMLSILLAGTIATPLRRLAAAADRVRRGVKQREAIPDFNRQDEIGHLARNFRDMTNALYQRMDAIESFAADVSHELKNPLTSLRSAVETLPLAKTEQSRAKLMQIIQHDVRRLDRLITDISDASRLDAELAREDARPVDLGKLLESVVTLASGAGRHPEISIKLTIKAKSGKAGEKAAGEKQGSKKSPPGTAHLIVYGHDSRLGQVIHNLIDNARSFSPPGGSVRISAARIGKHVEITVDDDGPGIRAEKIERIFERFYTDRPESEGFGNNSGLGLSISRQIVEAHRGTILAMNRQDDPTDPQRVTGARFVVILPAES